MFLPCGSHTVTGVPDLENNRLIVYSNVSSATPGNCPFAPTFDAIDIVEVPLDDPASASRIGEVPLTGGTLGSNQGCHDAGATRRTTSSARSASAAAGTPPPSAGTARCSSWGGSRVAAAGKSRRSKAS